MRQLGGGGWCPLMEAMTRLMVCSMSSEYKRARHEIKKKSSDTLKLQKKARKGKSPA